MSAPPRLSARERAFQREINRAMDYMAEGLGMERTEYGYPTGEHTVATLAQEVRDELLAQRRYAGRHRWPTSTT